MPGRPEIPVRSRTWERRAAIMRLGADSAGAWAAVRLFRR